ncbi:MAG: efflux RND transporter periplasmic adaptor subunit [Terracidiphilus sp.]
MFAVLGMAACHRGASNGDKANAVASARVAIAKRGDITQIITLAGQFQPYQTVDVHPKVSGYMSHIYVDIGDIVHQGETIAILEVPELRAELKQTIFELQQSKQQIVQAQHEINRAEAVHAALHAQDIRLQAAAATRPGLIAQQELDDALAKDLSSAAQVDAARAAMAAAEQHSEAAHADNQRVEALENYTRVTSPLDGVVIWRYSDTGALIQGGTNSNSQALPIVRIAQSGLLRLRVPVPEDDVHYVHLGDTLDIRVDALNRSLTGKVVRFTRSVNFETRTMQTEVDVENQDLSIDSGMYANTMLKLAEVKNVVTIPVGAIVLDMHQHPTVYVLDSGNRVHIRKIAVGVEGSLLAEVKNGLEAGDRVILGGQNKYQPGEQISPVVAVTPASETQQQTGGTIDMDAGANGGSQ